MRSIALLQENWVDEEKRRDWRAGVVWAATVNANRSSRSAAVKASDAFPLLAPDPPSPSEQLQALRRHFEGKE